MIKIGDTYALGSNNLNIVLYEKHIGKQKQNKGKEYWKEIAYFSNIHNALNYFAELEIRKTELTDLKIVCQKIDALYDLINNIQPITTSAIACVGAVKEESNS